MNVVKLCSVFLLVPFSMCEFQIPHMLNDQLFVHQLISNYLVAEQHLWSRSRSEDILSEIYNTNKYFLNKTLDIPKMKKNYNYYGYGYGLHGLTLQHTAEVFYLKIGDSLKYPIQKDKPDIFLSHNFTLELLEEAKKYYNLRSDLKFWTDSFNVSVGLHFYLVDLNKLF